MKKVAIIGCGRVGLPLAIFLADRGLIVHGIDIDQQRVDLVNQGSMPFYEEGADVLLQQTIGKNLFFTTDYSVVNTVDAIVVTVGTPVNEDNVADYSQVKSTCHKISTFLRPGQLILFRSTLAPRTTEFIRDYLENVTGLTEGKNFYLVFAPERIVEGKSLKELQELPQIVGAFHHDAFVRAKDFFSFAPEVLEVTPTEAELCKLFTNAYRFVNFALANEFFVIGDKLQVDVHKVIHTLNKGYKRANVPTPGFAKGPCLGKDSWLLLNAVPDFTHSTGLVAGAYRMNDGMPAYILGKVKSHIDLKRKKVAILGLTFKRDSDDLRNSLSLKLIDLLNNEFVDVVTHDPYVDAKPISEVLRDAHVVIIATNHSYYETLDFSSLCQKGTMIVDIWNLRKQGKSLDFI